MQLYPLLFRPNLHEIVWGGHRLIEYKKLASTPEGMQWRNHPIGESWEVSAVPSSLSVVGNGEYAGQTLDQVVAQYPKEILGVAVARQYNNQLPLLVKFIDAERDLSIQVHPNDEMAKRVHGKMGKTEMWYVIDAKPGSYLYAGFKETISPYEYQKRVEDGSICDVLARHEVKAGDVFYIPAGRVHAICGGILLAEVQQSSDVTYRIFDYNRPGMDGKPRELHTYLAAEALDYHVEEDYRTQYGEEGNRANHVIDSPFFSVRVTEIDRPFHRNLVKYDSFIISMCIEGSCKIRIRKSASSAFANYTPTTSEATGLDEIELQAGTSCLIPAAIADYDVIPTSRTCRILDAYIDNKDMSFGRMVTRFLHITNK